MPCFAGLMGTTIKLGSTGGSQVIHKHQSHTGHTPPAYKHTHNQMCGQDEIWNLMVVFYR